VELPNITSVGDATEKIANATEKIAETGQKYPLGMIILLAVLFSLLFSAMVYSFTRSEVKQARSNEERANIERDSITHKYTNLLERNFYNQKIINYQQNAIAEADSTVKNYLEQKPKSKK
jgi:flagellar basal body-associated protein FliL